MPPHVIDAKLEEWVSAKRSRDFATADRLRDELRASGVDAEAARPDLSRGVGAAKPRNSATMFWHN